MWRDWTATPALLLPPHAQLLSRRLESFFMAAQAAMRKKIKLFFFLIFK